MNHLSRLPEHAPSILVAALSAAFGVSLLQLTGALAAIVSADDSAGSSATVALVLPLVGGVFIVIATYVGAVVTANTFATIIAGRTRTIALLRLIGASARSCRRAVAREGLAVGLIGSALGGLAGTAVAALALNVAVATGSAPALAYDLALPVIAVPLVAVVATTWLASWVGSRRVLQVSPTQALAGAQERRHDERTGRRARTVVGVVLMALGLGLLALGMMVGMLHPIGIAPAVVGGALSFSGFVLAAQLVLPAVLRSVGRLFGTGAAARLASANAVRYPERSTRTTVGVVIGVTLVTMFAVAAASYQRALAGLFAGDPRAAASADALIGTTVAVFSALLGFSALLAAIGLVNNLSLSVLQRTRELGLLRALGFTNRQVRLMIVAECAQLTVAAVALGLVIGTFYGWAGAQSLLGSLPGSGALVVPVVPGWLVVTVVTAAAVLTIAAAIAPTRRATRIAPVVALAMD